MMKDPETPSWLMVSEGEGELNNQLLKIVWKLLKGKLY